MKIQILPPNIRDQIAAGEVVECPASVVKELVENALDASAKNIEIHVKDGGKKLIKVVDDGMGMSPEDTEKSVLRHATSKISNIEDLFAIQSFGFRGEALAAIASVSEFEIFSREISNDLAEKIKISAGTTLLKEKVSANVGTTVLVKNLFFPIPARLQYLKSADSEYRQILREVYGFVLSSPDVGFKIFKDEKLVLDFPAVSEEKYRVQQVLKKLSQNLVPIYFEYSGLKIFGFSSTPEAGIANRTHQFLFVNRRRIEDQKLCFAVREAYRQSCGIEKHLHPFFVLYMEIDPILVDINVHPRKLEVKFSEPGETFLVVKNSIIVALENFLSKKKTESQESLNAFENQEKTFQPAFFSKKPPQAHIFSGNNFNKIIPSDRTFSTNFRFSEKNQERNYQFFKESPPNISSETHPTNEVAPNTLKLLGQSANKYLVAENEKGIYFFDQHALHERQRFETFWQEYKKKKIATQPLLMPHVLSFTESEISVFFEQKAILEKLGFLLEFPEDDMIRILEIPHLLADQDLENIFRELLNYFENEQVGEMVIDQIMRKLLEYKSCRGAVMFGDKLEHSEMEKLIKDFDKTNWALLCPHGRPNNFFISFEELDKKFHR